jgi:ATP-dependent helicase HrpA
VVLDEGKDLVALQRRLATHTQDAVRVAVRSAVRDAVRESTRQAATATSAPTTTATAAATAGPPAAGAIAEQPALTGWPAGLPAGRIPTVVETAGPGGIVVRGYPALVEEAGPGRSVQVALRVLADPGTQAGAHRRGLRRLLVLETGLPTGRITSRWSGTQSLTLAASPYPSTDALVADVQLASVDALLTASPATAPDGAAGVRDLDSYTRLRDAIRRDLEDVVLRTVTDLVAALAAARQLDSAVRGATSLALLNTLQDIRSQAATLVHAGFVAEAGAARLPHIARYLRAAGHRLAKAADNPNRDAEIAWRIRDLEDGYAAARARAARAAPDPDRTATLAEVHWMLQELRVSLFAQQLGTPGPISEKRIRSILTS